MFWIPVAKPQGNLYRNMVPKKFEIYYRIFREQTFGFS